MRKFNFFDVTKNKDSTAPNLGFCPGSNLGRHRKDAETAFYSENDALNSSILPYWLRLRIFNQESAFGLGGPKPDFILIGMGISKSRDIGLDFGGSGDPEFSGYPDF